MGYNTANTSPHKKTEAELENNSYTKEHEPPDELHHDAKDTLFAWTDDGKGVWTLPTTKANFERFENITRSRPYLGHDTRSHCDIMRLAGAQFFADWRDSDRARAAKEAGQRAVEEVNEARDYP